MVQPARPMFITPKELRMTLTTLCPILYSTGIELNVPLFTDHDSHVTGILLGFEILLFVHFSDVTCAPDSSSFAVLALLPKSSACMGSNEPSLVGKDGVILLFNATDPVPLAMWSVRKVCCA